MIGCPGNAGNRLGEETWQLDPSSFRPERIWANCHNLNACTEWEGLVRRYGCLVQVPAYVKPGFIPRELKGPQFRVSVLFSTY